MKLDGESAVGRLNPISPPDSSHFTRKTTLLFVITYVLNDGVAEDDVKRLVTEQEHTAVPSHLPQSPRGGDTSALGKFKKVSLGWIVENFQMEGEPPTSRIVVAQEGFSVLSNRAIRRNRK